jgi:putative aminopeptidase FrvX
MPRNLLDSFGRVRSERRARRVLEQELADYTTAADRDELAALLAGRGSADSETAEILSRQARVELFRAS